MPVRKIKKVINENRCSCINCGKNLRLGLLGILTKNDVKWCPDCGQKNRVKQLNS